MNTTSEVQATVSFVPYRMTHVGEGDAFFHIIKYYNDDLEAVHNGIETTKQRLDDFYHNEYLPNKQRQKK